MFGKELFLVLIKRIEDRKAVLIDKLLANGVYKTADQRHLYDAPLKVLEDEYRIILKNS